MRRRRIWLLPTLISLTLVSALFYLSIWVFLNYKVIAPNIHEGWMIEAIMTIIKRRVPKLLALIIVAILTATSSLVFQTLTNNRILTPSVLGFDAIFVVTQTIIIALFGLSSVFILNEELNFIIVTIIMISVVLLLYKLILRRNKNNIVFLLLFGMIISVFARSVSNFLQVLLHPDNFTALLGMTQVTIVNMNTNLIYLALPLLVVLLGLFLQKHRTYDVMALGEEYAINLGVNYYKETKISLIYIAIAISIATALVGPLSFLGLIAVNVSRELFKSNKHAQNIIYASLVALVFLILGQVIVEIIGYITTVTVLIELVGGFYLIYLVLKENKND